MRASAPFKTWLPVVSLSCAAFVFNTSEFVPIGLLNAIASDFHMSEAHAGLLVSIYAWVVALFSLPLMLLCSRVELKRLMLCVIALFTLSHFLSAFSSGYYILMVSRIGVALSHSLFWSIASPMAVNVAPKGKQSMALGFIITGTSLAMVAGLPLGRVIGLYIDWRTTFGVIGVFALLIGILFYVVFPTIEPLQTSHPTQNPLDSKHRHAAWAANLLMLIKNEKFLRICFLTMIFITAHFTAYTYIEPLLAQVSGFSDGAITFVLVLFGLMGIISSVLFSKYYDRFHKYFVFGCLFGLWISFGGLYLIESYKIAVIMLCAFWGMCIMFFGLVFQSQTIAISKEASMIAMSIYSGIYNVGIASGAMIGGAVVNHIGIAYVGLAASLLALLAGLYFVFKMPFARVFNRWTNEN